MRVVGLERVGGRDSRGDGDVRRAKVRDDEAVGIRELADATESRYDDTHGSKPCQPPPTRTMTVLERRMRQKYNRPVSASPIQYMPDSSLYAPSAAEMGTCICDEKRGQRSPKSTNVQGHTSSSLTIRPTSTSTLRFGLTLYTFLTLGGEKVELLRRCSSSEAFE